MTTLSQICLLVAVVLCGAQAQYERPYELFPSAAREDPLQYGLYRNGPPEGSAFPSFYYLAYGQDRFRDRSSMPLPPLPPAMFAPFPLRTGSFRSDPGDANATQAPVSEVSSTETPVAEELLNATSEGEDNSTVSEAAVTPVPAVNEKKASLGVINVPKFSNGHHYPLPMWSWIASEYQDQRAAGESPSPAQNEPTSNVEIKQKPYQKYMYVPNIMPTIPQQFWSPGRLPVSLSYREAEQQGMPNMEQNMPMLEQYMQAPSKPSEQQIIYPEPMTVFYNEPAKRFGPEPMPQFMDGQAENHIPSTAFLPPQGLAPRYYILYTDPLKFMQRSQEPRV